MDFSQRSQATEWMDTEVVSDADFGRCLTDLATVNRLSLGHRPTLRWLERATRGWPAGTALSVLDVAFGHGDMLRAIWRWGRRRGFALSLSGVDLNPASAAAARAATPADWAIAYHTGDVFDYVPAEPVDFVVSALFTHHLGNDDVTRFVAWMERVARRGWFINDLHRHWLAYYGLGAIARLAGWHRFVRHDGPVSIARSFRRADWRTLLGAAPATIEPWSNFRLCVSRLK